MEEQRLLLLYNAITSNKPWIVIGILSAHPELISRRLTSGESILTMAVKRKSSGELIKKLIQLMPHEGLAMTDNFGNTVLHMVESTQIATLLLAKSPNLLFVRNNSGETPLMTAIKTEYRSEYIVEIIEMTSDEGLCIQDDDGSTVLHMVVLMGNIELTELLLTKCPSLMLKCTNFKQTPFMVAAKGGCSSDMMKKLIQFTSSDDLAMQDEDGNTVLHMASMTGNIELTEMLLMKCPTLLLSRNNSQYLPIHLTVKQGHCDMQEYLLSLAEQQGYGDPYAAVTSEDLLHSAIRAGMTDVAVILSYNNPLLVSNLVREEQNLPDESAMKDAKSKLYEAIANDSQEEVKSILLSHHELTTTSLSGETPITVALAERCSFDMIKIIVEHTPDVALALTDDDGYTALHFVAILGSIQLATLLLSKNPSLPSIRNNSGDVPINIAIINSHKDLTNYLFNKAIEEGYDDPFVGAAHLNVLLSALLVGMYDLAYWLDQKYPNLAMNDDRVLKFLAMTQPFSYWKAALLRTLECILRIDLSVHKPILETMLSSICKRVADQGDDNASSVFRAPFLSAAQNGSKTIVSEILSHYPKAIHFLDTDNRSIYHLAVMYRHENIFKIAYQSNVLVSRHLSSKPDNNGNNVLHLAAHLPHENRLGQSNKVILQMQRELKWFKELENLLLPIDTKLWNDEGKTPLTIFKEKHEDLVAKEIQWMTSMASACSVVASLIATVAFAAAITVPGGNNSNGLPIFSNHKSFIVFAASDAIALFASINSVLSFLAIFTSRFSVDDFLYALPNRLIIGLISLFISAISLMVAFGTTLFLVFGQNNSLILIPIIAFSCAPVIQYTFLQLPSLLEMIKSTYG